MLILAYDDLLLYSDKVNCTYILSAWWHHCIRIIHVDLSWEILLVAAYAYAPFVALVYLTPSLFIFFPFWRAMLLLMIHSHLSVSSNILLFYKVQLFILMSYIAVYYIYISLLMELVSSSMVPELMLWQFFICSKALYIWSLPSGGRTSVDALLSR
jgi:hypothetical protein